MIADHLHLSAGRHPSGLCGFGGRPGGGAPRKRCWNIRDAGQRAVNVLVQLLDREGNVAAQDSMPVTVQEHTKIHTARSFM